MSPRTLLTCVALLLCMTSVMSQTNARIRQLEKQRSELLDNMRKSEQLLAKAGKDISSQLNALSQLEAQITERQNYVNRLNADIRAIDDETRKVEADIAALTVELDKAKDDYARSLRYIRSGRSIQEKLMFIFSASSLQQVYRRLRYLQEYSSFRKAQGQEITRKRAALQAKEREMREVIAEKKKLLAEVEKEKENLAAKQQEQQKMLKQLRGKQSAIRKEVAAQKRESDRLNRQIDRLVEEEIERARREEEKRRAEAEAAKGRGGTSSVSEKKMDAYKMNNSDRRLADDFEKNKGILPVPVTGSYLVVNHYGRYNVAGLKGVQLDNKGIDIQATPGAMARAIFRGEVSAVFEYAGLKGVLVRHGNYISVYCNLSSVLVRQGDRLETRQAIGKIYSDPTDGDRTVLHFQLRRETSKLNPEAWIDD